MGTSSSRRATGLGGALLVLILASVGSGSATACSCAEPLAPLEALVAADAVFAGTVEQVLLVPGVEDRLEVGIRVGRVWKGAAIPSISVWTSASEPLCGYPKFEKETTFLVYARKTPEGELVTDVCSRTNPLSEAIQDLKELGPAVIVTIEAATWSGAKAHFRD